MTGALHLNRIPSSARGVRVAVIDSGVHADHPHVQGVFDGVGIDTRGAVHPDFVDRLGHGTAVTAAIREKAPDAEILAIKVFDRQLAATGAALTAAIDWAVEHESHIISLSLGTTNSHHEEPLARAAARARAADTVIVAAAPTASERWLPGALPGVVSVSLDWTLPRDVCDVELTEGAIHMRASGYPRPIPGVGRERNLKGLSFAVANAAGLLARVVGIMREGTRRVDYLSTTIAGMLEVVSGTAPSS